MSQALWSATNVFNSIATLLGAKMLAEGYLLYWHFQDGLETPDGWYGEFSTRDTTLLQDATVAARVAAAKGLLTIRGPVTASPVFVVRPTISGAVDSQNEVNVPCLAIDVGAAFPVDPYELGTKVKWRRRRLTIQGFARTWFEMKLFEDRLSEWFDMDEELEVLNHDAGTLASLGSVGVKDPSVEGDLEVPGSEPATFGVELNAHLEYVT